jgi:hypothetical protein
VVVFVAFESGDPAPGIRDDDDEEEEEEEEEGLGIAKRSVVWKFMKSSSIARK